MAGQNNTAFSPDADIVAQMTGTGAPTPGYNGPATIGAGVRPVYAATIALAPFLQKSRYVEIPGSNTTSAACTVSTTNVGTRGARLIVNVLADATGTVTITFGTGFKSTGTVAATASTNFPVEFVSNGVAWVELCRPTAAIAN